jgi:hypothetical protein
MGHLDLTCRAPPRLRQLGEDLPGGARGERAHRVRLARARFVAMQVAFERQNLKPVFSLDRL